MDVESQYNQIEEAVRAELCKRDRGNEDLEDQITWDAALIVWNGEIQHLLPTLDRD